MGYAPRTYETIAQLLRQLRDLEQSDRADDGWVAGQRFYLSARIGTVGGIAHFYKLTRICVDLGLIERRTNIPHHLDQRMTYWRCTDAGRKCILDGQATAPAAQLRQITGQMTIDQPTDTRQE